MPTAAAGTLAGIARHAARKAPMELINRVEVSVDGGIHGDYRGTVKPGGRGRRQVTLIERGDWDSAMRELQTDVPWFERRANLLVEGVDLPQIEGALIRVGKDVVLRVTVECEPCTRMENVARGLMTALTPDWRGGACTRVVAGGSIAVGDEIRIEEA